MTRLLMAATVMLAASVSYGQKGLKIIRKKNNADYTLAIDPGKRSSKMYSSGKMEFDNYVIDSDSVVRGVIDGTKTDRATAKELINVLKTIEKEK